MDQIKVAELTVDQLRVVIREAVIQTLEEILRDPDEGLSLHDEIQTQLQASLAEPEGRLIKAHDLAEKLGLEW